MISNEQLDAWEQAADKALRGPWLAEHGMSGRNWVIGTGATQEGELWCVTTDGLRASEYDGDAQGDAEFIAAARTAVPALIAEVRRLREMNSAMLTLLLDSRNVQNYTDTSMEMEDWGMQRDKLVDPWLKEIE